MTWLSRWKICTCKVQPGVEDDWNRLEELLQELWEPFTVTWADHCFVYHLRKMGTTKETKK